ncbi:MAG: succinate dehydrogenase, cytochrome b556 subunit [Halobacteria archaeon]|nr:succinate dehydrogenase, cytochrome b556 subunit [Halobacteria archaeon]
MSSEKRVEGYDRGLLEKLDLRKWKDWEPGMWAFYLHRVTGLTLSFYLVMHLTVLGTAWWMGYETYTDVIHGLESLFVVKVLEVGLFAAFVFHALNGTRIVLFDMTKGLDIQEQLFYLSVSLSFVFVVISVPFFLLG